MPSSKRIRSERRQAAQCIFHLTALLTTLKVMKVVLWIRVSHEDQRPHLAGQEAYLRQVMASMGIEVVGRAFGDVYESWQLERSEFHLAIAYARKHGAIIVAESADRYVRHINFHLNRKLLSTISQLKELKRLARGVTLATLLRPEASSKEVASHQKKRGQAASGNKGGRPVSVRPASMNDRRQDKKPHVLKLRRNGKKLREIAAITGIPTATAHRWIQNP